MILKLNDTHKSMILNYVGKEPSINLFIIGDIEQYGFDKDFQDIWASFDEDNNVNGILLRYMNNFVPYIDNVDTDVEEFKQIIKSYEGEKIISGKGNIIEKFKDVLNDYNEKVTYFCELRDDKKLVNYDDSVKIATEEDASRMQDLLLTIDEFTIRDSVETTRSRIKDNSKTVYYIENEEKEMISVSQVTAENSKSAMIIGVATRKEYREQGYMSKCLSKLCKDLLNRGKSLCLFYDNPKAGKVYHKLGFKEIGIWTMLVENKF